MIKAILFDFNGVIIDDERVQMSAYTEVLKGLDVELTETEYFSCLGMDDKTFVRTAFERKGRTASAEEIDLVRAKKSDRWRELIDGRIPLFPGVEDFVVSAAREFSIGIVSMSKRSDIEFVLDQTGLRKYFSHITSSEDVTNHKPDPQCYKHGFEALASVHRANAAGELKQGETLVIEDAPQGVVAALGAGLRPIGVSNTVTAERLREAGAEAVLSQLRGWTPIAFKTLFKS
jgi:beta-phosphoglucomutase